jgi:hypothetical protein
MLIELVNKQKNRVMGSFEWSAQNGRVCDVLDTVLLNELFTHPAYTGQFRVSADEPLVKVTGSESTAELLVIYGEITTIENLAALSKEDVERLSTKMLETKRTVNGWVSQARKLVLEDGSDIAVVTVTEADSETAVSEPDEQL